MSVTASRQSMWQCSQCARRFYDNDAGVCVVDGSPLVEVVLSSSREALVGVTVGGRYLLERVLGDGGMGVVYGGVDPSGRPIAVKVLRAEYSDDADLVSRFQTEAEAVAKARHPNVVELIEFGVLPDGARFFVMELLEGQSLGALLKERGPSPYEPSRRQGLPELLAVHIAGQIGAALAAAHSAGVVHRDLKPDNIHLVQRDGDPYFVKVLDFGIAKVHNARHAKTRTGSVFGTPHYMSPEQANGDTDIDGRSDVYSLGSLLYEMVAGRVPFDADNLMGILMAHMHQAPTPLSSLPGVQITPGLEAVILRAMAKDRGERYPTMEIFVSELRSVSQGLAPVALSMTPPSMPGVRASMPPPAFESQGQGLAASMAPVVGSRAGEPLRSVWQSPAVLGLTAVAVASFALAGILALARRPRPPVQAMVFTTAPPPARNNVPLAPAVAPPAPEPAMITVHTEPEGATLSFGRTPLGVTPLRVPRPAGADTRSYVLELAGRMRTSLTVRADTPAAMQVLLPPAPSAPAAGTGAAVRRPPAGPAPPGARTGDLMDPWNTPPH